MSAQKVSLHPAAGLPDQIIGTATLSNLPDDRYPDDLSWLAPVISVQDTAGKTRLFRLLTSGFGYGQQSDPHYQEVMPVEATAAWSA